MIYLWAFLAIPGTFLLDAGEFILSSKAGAHGMLGYAPRGNDDPPPRGGSCYVPPPPPPVPRQRCPYCGLQLTDARSCPGCGHAR